MEEIRNLEKEKLNTEIGKRISKARKQMSMTQETLSEKISVSSQYISNLERGLVGASVETVIKLCSVLQVSSDYILTGKQANSSTAPKVDFKKLSKAQLSILSDTINMVLDTASTH